VLYTSPSVLSIVAVIASFVASGQTGFVLAVLAITLGVFGVIASVLPSGRSPGVKIAAISMGAIGVLAAFVRLLI
jgi:hypothetical protein